jgi:S1-C subfamily serine protease
MKSSKLSRQLTSHFIALLLGVFLCFGGFRMLSSVAEPVAKTPPAQNQNSLVSQAVSAVPVPISENSFVAAAVNRTGAAVVRIDTEAVVTRRLDPMFDDPFFRDFFGDRFRMAPQQQRVAGQGSGFIIDRSGVILTNAHVVSNADKVTVTLKDGRTFNGEVKGSDEVTDLAVVKINSQGSDLPVASLGDSGAVQVGDWAIAVGNPVGLDNTVTLGIVSTISRSAAKAGIPDKRLDFIQTDAAINPGNSGGPLLNAKGDVIGINTAIRADAMGIGFAIPINKAKSLEKFLAAGKRVPHPYIGVQMLNLTPELAKESNQNPNSPFLVPEVQGILVVRVMPNTPAERAGIRMGDVILSVDNQKVTDGGQLQDIVENVGLDRSLKLKVQRGDRTMDVTVQTAQLSNAS